MNKAQEKLQEVIRTHPKSRIAGAYRLGKLEGKNELLEANSRIRDLETLVEELRRQELPASSKKDGGTLIIDWANGSRTRIKLATMAPLPDLVKEGHFLLIPQEDNNHRGEIVNLANVLLISQH